MSRTSFSIAAALVAALIFTGFRLWLYLEHRSGLPGPAPVPRLGVFWVGFRLDGVIVSRTCALVVLSALLFPEWLFTASQPFLLGYLGLLFFVCFCGEICGLYFFRYYDCRPNYLVFEHGADKEVVKTV